MVRATFCIYFFIFLCSCGKQKFPDYRDDSFIQDEQLQDQHFQASLKALNNSKIDAQYVLWIKDNQFYARIYMKRGFRMLRFQQYIHKGPKCPGLKSDLNQDHVIDHQETIIASGEMLIPLDRDLISQQAGNGWFPETDHNGTYYYSESTWVIDMLKDLRSHLNNHLGRLSDQEPFNLDQRTLVIYGTETDPLTPVACAEI